MVGKKVMLTNKRDDGKFGRVVKHIQDDIYRIRLDNGARTVVSESEFKLVVVND